jgi:hypothetical protein
MHGSFLALSESNHRTVTSSPFFGRKIPSFGVDCCPTLSVKSQLRVGSVYVQDQELQDAPACLAAEITVLREKKPLGLLLKIEANASGRRHSMVELHDGLHAFCSGVFRRIDATDIIVNG